MELKINHDYLNPENNYIEIVERKGMGHPDTLADKLAEECSRVYSLYCLNKFGCVLHHNFDKLYIGAGLFKYEDNQVKKYNNIRIDLNGRASDTMNGEKINISEILKPVIEKYMKSVMPRIHEKEDLDININCTQFSKRDYWYSPRDINDVPDATSLTANDTSLCVAHGGRTFCEQVAFNVEQMFWDYSDGYYPHPKYDDIGQDIKVMVSRVDKHIDITLCVPVYKDKYKTEEEYVSIVKKYENKVLEEVDKIDNPNHYHYEVGINRLPGGLYRNYSLILGSCCECGEEGVVGRGNSAQGLISAFRQHTMEAPCGKNTRYHTGKVLAFMANNATERIYKELGIKNSIYCLTRNKNSLLEPFVFYLSIDQTIDKDLENKILEIIHEEFNENFLEKILLERKLV